MVHDLVHELVHWLVHDLVHELVHWLVHYLVHESVHWLVLQLVYQLVPGFLMVIQWAPQTGNRSYWENCWGGLLAACSDKGWVWLLGI